MVNCIIFSKRAPIGTVAINTNELCTNQGCIACVKKEECSEEYYYYVSYDSFAKGLQSELADAVANRPKSITPELFMGKTITDVQGNTDIITDDMAREIYVGLRMEGYIDKQGTLTDKFDVSGDVAVYVKLPDGFYISTPVGKYNPDWAIAFYEKNIKHIYFVAETKGSMNSMQLRLIEESKIHCAKEHFKAISGGNVVYDVVDSYQSLLDKVMK